MIGPTLRKTVLIANPPDGFHMRPAMRFVAEAQKYQSTIHVIKGNQRVDGKSMFDILLVLTLPGGQITVEVTGDDAEEALATLVKVVNEPAGEPNVPPGA
jgi:phosphocarrier protein